MDYHKTSLRVRYKETDQMGVAYYSNYLVWFEVARAELFRDVGYVYADIEKDLGLRLMVVEARCRYRYPAHYDELIDIYSSVENLGNTSLKFVYKVKHKERILAEGDTVHVFTDDKARPRRIPKELKEVLR